MAKEILKGQWNNHVETHYLKIFISAMSTVTIHKTNDKCGNFVDWANTKLWAILSMPFMKSVN